MESKTSHRRLTRAERQREAWKMRLTGRSTYEIGRQLGVDHATISKDLKDQYALYRQQCEAEAADATRLQLSRLEALLIAVWPAAESGDTKSIAEARKLIDQIARILGVYAPLKVEATGPEQSVDALRAQLAALLDPVVKP